VFDRDTTLAILSGFNYNKRVLVQGYHGTGKSTHIEQIAARLNWPCIRVNLDSHISRIDLIGKDAIILKDNKQVTEFREGILTTNINTQPDIKISTKQVFGVDSNMEVDAFSL
jgi:cobaltochelatase CobS